LDTGVVEIIVPVGEYTFYVEVKTEYGDTFTGSTFVALTQGDNPPVTVSLEVNAPPTINSLSASNSNPETDETISITADVFDHDGDDNLNYSWSASAGSISGGSTASWTAPVDTASATITLTLTDGKGGSTTLSLTILIKAKPIVDSVSVSNESPDINDDITLTCTAHDANNNIDTYSWTGTDGFTGTGASTTYTVTSTDAVTFTCTVTDATGLTDTGTVSIFLITSTIATTRFEHGVSTSAKVWTAVKTDANSTGYCAAVPAGSTAPEERLKPAPGAT
jgi:hypothetical protein